MRVEASRMELVPLYKRSQRGPSSLPSCDDTTRWPSKIEEMGLQLSSVAQSCLTLCNPMDYSLPGFPVHGILQTRDKSVNPKGNQH